MVSGPRPVWAFFVIFAILFLLHGFARTFFKSAIGFTMAGDRFVSAHLSTMSPVFTVWRGVGETMAAFLEVSGNRSVSDIVT